MSLCCRRCKLLLAIGKQKTVDEIWLTQHQPVFTQGQAGKAEHVLLPGDIPVVQSDRGGQVTITGLGKSPPTCYLICGDWALV